MAITITKADGTVEEFDRKKLLGSLERAGATEESAAEIADEVGKHMHERATTHDIYQHAFELLRKHRREAAARYSLKRAVLDFGPSGFPFEAYLAELFRKEGYEASIDQHVMGSCVEHEVDILLKKEGEEVYVEAKFHNTVGFKTDLQVALYVQARVEDIERARNGHSHGASVRGMLVTNTKFTSLAVQYAGCRKLELLGWEYPAEGNLHDRIEKAGLYPITALTTLSHAEKTALLADRVVLCRDVSRHESALLRAGVPKERMDEVLMEAGGLCASQGKVQ